ncbi:MAG: TonB family protein [Elusimicrobiota bacterium]|nr:MAG: TonB family protein [Elusimicrobiota bacterium]
MPASVVISVAVHAAFLVLFMGLVKEGPKQAAQIVEGVDLLIAPSRPAQQTPAVVKKELSTMDFLKMALPAAPARRAELASVDLKVPERRRDVLAEPKLEERTRKSLAPALEALDLARSRSAAATLDAEPMTRRRAAQTLAAMPKLEDVGRRRVKNLPEAIALEDKRMAATAMLAGPLDAPAPTSRRAVLAAAAKLEEAEGAPAATARKTASFLPDAIELKPRGATGAAAAPKFEAISETPKLERRRQAAASVDDAPKKGIEIEGPLKDRKVLNAAVPTFPDWAKAQRIMEAEVAIRFTVDADGAVMPGMTVERGSGYGRLDRLCMEHLKNWTFAKAPGSGAQWGVITFRFLLE